MNEYDKLLKLSTDERVELAASFKEVLHKELVLGQTRYVCRYGTLSDGHEKLTPSQRYYQAIKEMYYLGCNMRSNKATALLAQADLIDANDDLASAIKASDKMRAEARAIQAQERLVTALTSAEDQMRMLDEYNNIRLELKPIVEAQYPHGIEQAEEDNWKAVFEYRMHKERLQGAARERVDNIPLNPIIKAQLGYPSGRIDAIAPLAVANPKECERIGRDFEKEVQSLTYQEQNVQDPQLQ